MKIFLKIVGIILLVIALLITGVVIWQWENVRAVYMFVTSDAETISANIEEKRIEQEETLAVYEVTVQAPTAVQSNDLLDGKVTPEQVKQDLGITQELEKAESPAEEAPKQPPADDVPKPQEKPKDDAASVQKQVQELINRCVAELYACEVDLMAVLGGMKKKAIAEWNSLDRSTRTSADLRAIGMRGLNECYDMEVGVDKQVKAILDKYRAEMKALKADASILDTLWRQYCDKKANQKAYYLNKYAE